MFTLKNSNINLLALGYIALGISSLGVIVVPALYFQQSQIGVIGICLSLQYILSQLFGSGLHFSSLYYKSVALSTSENNYCSISSKINVTLVTVFFGLLFYFLFPLIASIYDNFSLNDFKGFLILSVIFIAINKVLLSELNAVKKFNLIGKLYLVKSLVFSGIILLVVINKIDFKNYINCQLLLPELIIYLYYLSKTLILFFKRTEAFSLKHTKRDLLFGAKSLWGTIFFEASTKIDVLLLGIYVTPERVGIYSIISMISDLFLNISSVLRTLVNPDITMNFINNKSNFIKFINTKIKMSYKVLVPFLLLTTVVYYGVTTYMSQLLMYKEGFYSLLILAFFLSLASGFIPLMLTFGQIGKPNLQSLTFFVFFMSNLILNIVLIPLFGIEGASIATGLSYLIYVFCFNRLLLNLDK